MVNSKMRIDNSSKFGIIAIFHFVLNFVYLNLNEQLQLQIQHTLNKVCVAFVNYAMLLVIHKELHKWR